MARSGHVRFHGALDGILIPIDDVTPHPQNPNNGDVDAIIDSIRINGFYPQPLVVDRRNGRIIIGNHRYFALKELGSQVAPVFYVDSDDEIAAIRIMLTDNRLSDLRKYDQGLLRESLEFLKSQGGLEGTGFTDAYLQRLQESDQDALDLVDPSDSTAMKDLTPVGSSLLFIEASPEDVERFHRYTEMGSDTERFRDLLDQIEENYA